jgi:cytoskeletal protein CcmA (bactofilin family)
MANLPLEFERTHPAAELVAAIRSRQPVRLDGAVVEGDVDLDAVDYPHKLVIVNTVFLGHVHVTEGRFAHTVDLSGCEFRQNLNFFGTRVDGQLKLQRARIFLGEKPVRHNFDQIEVVGRLNGTQLESHVPLSFRQARLGEIGFDGLRVDGDLDLQIAKVAGDLFCQGTAEHPAEIRGEAKLTGIQVGGHVDIRGVRVLGGLDLANAEIREDLRCSTAGGHRTELSGLVSLAGARIGGVAHFGGARIGPAVPSDEAGREHVFVFHGAEIRRGLRVCPDGDFRPEILGGVFGASAKVSHVLVFDRARVEGDLDFERVTVNGRMLFAFDDEFYACRPDAPAGRVPGRLEVTGGLNLSGAQVQELVIDGRLFDPPDAPDPQESPRTPRSSGSRHRREFFRRLLTGQSETGDEKSRLKLDRARLSRLEIRERIPEGIGADGMTFDDLKLPCVTGECEYSQFLRRTRPFKRSTYLAVESWLHNKGLDEASARVYIEMSDRDLNTGRTPRLLRWLKWLFLGVAIGYGARPRRLIGLFVVAFALSCWIFSHPDALVSYSEVRAHRPDPWPAEAQSAWVTLGAALRCHFPMLLFVGEPNYVPSPATIPGLALTYNGYALLISAISWVMVPLFLAGLTGIVRKRQ